MPGRQNKSRSQFPRIFCQKLFLGLCRIGLTDLIKFLFLPSSCRKTECADQIKKEKKQLVGGGFAKWSIRKLFAQFAICTRLAKMIFVNFLWWYYTLFCADCQPFSIGLYSFLSYDIRIFLFFTVHFLLPTVPHEKINIVAFSFSRSSWRSECHCAPAHAP